MNMLKNAGKTLFKAIGKRFRPVRPLHLLLMLALGPVLYWAATDGKFFFKEDAYSKSAQYYDFSSVETSFGDIPFEGMRPLSRDLFEESVVRQAPSSLRKNLSKILTSTLQLSEWYRIDPFWVLAIMWTESHYDHSSHSPSGALGVMQLMPGTGKYLSSLLNRNVLFLNGSEHGECGEVVDLPYASYSFSKGERGPILPVGKGIKSKMLNPTINVEMGIIYLKCLLKVFNNDHELATIAYNLGPEKIKEFLNVRQFRNEDTQIQLLSFTSRNRYLKKVRAAYEQLSLPFRNFLHYL